jgi:hypothetical protein
MLVKLLPENVTDNWEVVKEAIRKSLPPFAIDTPDKMTRILESIVLGQLEVWVYYEFEDEKLSIKNITTTSIITDAESQTKNLLIYSTYSFGHTQIEDWQAGLTDLAQYAKSNDCAAITAFTRDAHVLKFLESVGAEIETRFIRVAV